MEAKDEAFFSGKEAFAQRKHQSANPYAWHGEQELWEAWLQGWYSEYFRAKKNG